MLFSPKNHPRPSHQGWLTGDRIAEIKNLNLREPSEREIASSTSEFGMNPDKHLPRNSDAFSLSTASS
jgi:hypothetical protein